ncbi:MAG: hypothetical protein K2Q20_11160 [Phycisphaerales bacterium]|nr:hypothetical protein [Phycisphaerales bacterium]
MARREVVLGIGGAEGAGGEVVEELGAVVVVIVVVVRVVGVFGWAGSRGPGLGGGGVAEDADGGEATLARVEFGVAEEIAEGGEGEVLGVGEERGRALGTGHRGRRGGRGWRRVGWRRRRLGRRGWAVGVVVGRHVWFPP